MSMIVSVKELKTALKLIGVHSNLAHIFFGLGSKPMLVTFDDENKEEQCRAIISLADTHEINEDEEQSQAAATQSGVINNSHDRSLQSSNGFVPSQNSSRQQQQRHNDGEEPPLKQRRKAAPNNILNNRSKRGFSFEDDVADENEEIHQVQNDSNDDSEIFPSSGNRDGDVRGSRNSSLNNRSFQPQNSINNANSSLNNRSFQQHDFDDIQIAPSPSAPPPPPPPERNSTSPYCIALRLLGIEDQISDPEAEDVLETYDLPSTDPNEDLQQQQRHNDDEEPPLKQRRKTAPNNILNNRSKRGFSFEDDVADENEEIHQVQNDSNDDSEIFPSSGNRDGDVPGSRNSSLNNRNFQPQNSINNANSSMNNRSFQQHDFDDIQIAPSPSEPPPPPPPERNSTSPYCIALRLLGIEDQISDPEAEDVLETYDLPSTDPNEDLYIMSQFPG
uniref:Uncharacterized protein n=1 Tax=Panagrolaimus sp. ES5 TaxID=591445 RepID=A0AC34FKU8_9BILA